MIHRDESRLCASISLLAIRSSAFRSES